MRPCLIIALAAISMAACGANPAGQVCEVEVDTPATGPAILTPTAGRFDVIAENLIIEIEPPVDREHLRTEIEIWRYANGQLLVRAWRGDVDELGDLASVNLERGEYEGIAQELGLIEGQGYAVRARHLLAPLECQTASCCGEWSDWSPDRSFQVEDGSSTLFDDTQILDVAIELDQASMDAINAEARPPGCVPFNRSYHPGNAIVDGIRFDGVGVRSKGGCGSARNLDGKTAFKVHLSFDDPAVPGCPETRRVYGREHLTFNNQVQDRSFTRERLAYHYYKLMGVPTPRVAHTRLAVNGEHWGLYLNVESIDRRMLKRWFSSNDGMLYEGTYFCDILPDNIPPNLEDDFCIQAKFSADACDGSPDPGADPLDYSPVRSLADAIEALPDGGFYPAITELIDWDRFVSLWAADAVLGHWDGYAYDIINNYRVYHDPIPDRWMVIPTGIDQTLDRTVDPFAPSGLLATRCLAEPACEQTFLDRLAEAVDVFEQANLIEMSQMIEAQIAAEVAADPRKEGGDGAFGNTLAALRDYITRRPGEVRAALQNR